MKRSKSEPKSENKPGKRSERGGQPLNEVKLILVGRGGLYGNCLRISPPLTVTAAEVDEALGKLDESLAAIGA